MAQKRVVPLEMALRRIVHHPDVLNFAANPKMVPDFLLGNVVRQIVYKNRADSFSDFVLETVHVDNRLFPSPRLLDLDIAPSQLEAVHGHGLLSLLYLHFGVFGHEGDVSVADISLRVLVLGDIQYSGN